ncbi:MAG: lipocalin-like domain-containing protein [Acetobacteraceae bacterium]
MSSGIVGTWRLVKAMSVGGDGKELPGPYGGDKAMGRVTFNADGRMMAVLCDGRPTLPEGAVREYNSYCGNYTFDGTRLVTRVDASSAATRLGSEQVRDVHYEGALMVLRPPQRPYGERVEQRTLWWEKISDV